MITIRTFYLIIFSLLAYHALAQPASQRGNEGHVLGIHISYAVQLPASDLADRFGYNFNVGGGVEWLTDKRNIIMGVEGGYLFGQQVREDVLSPLRSPDGFLLGRDGGAAVVSLRQRGLYIGGLIGKLWPLRKNNTRSGLRLTLGGGILQHKVRIQDDTQSVTQLEGAYKKGYDRLSNGVALQEFIGYQHLSHNRQVNFFAGFEFTQAFTHSRRSWDFDRMAQEDANRLDILFGFRVGWTLALYLAENPDEIFY